VTAVAALRQLIRAYLYDGYLEMEYTDAWHAVDDFARLEEVAAPQLRGEIDDLVRSSRSEAELRTLIVDDLKSAYRPDEDGWTYRSWLGAVADRVDHLLQFPGHMKAKPSYGRDTGVKMPKMKGASSFSDRETAESSVAAVLQANEERVATWLGSTGAGLRLACAFADQIGRMAVAFTGDVIDVTGVVVILRRSEEMPSGYRVHTAYPAALSNPTSATGGRDALAQFLGVYLHQDWADDYPDVWSAVADFVAADRDIAIGLRRDVADLLSSSESEAALQSVVIDDLDCWYMPGVEGWAYRAWLEAVADRIDELLQQSAAP
jgi:hypothetical protein